MLNQKLVQVLAWLETGGILRIFRIWLPISVACFAVTAILNGVAIYLEMLKGCHATFDGKPIGVGLNWFVLYFSGMIMLAFFQGKTDDYRAKLEEALNSTDYDVQFKFMAIYVPILVFSIFTFIPPVLAAVLLWKTAA